MTGLDLHRVAEVIVTLDDGTGRRASGYRLSRTTVLTAAHVVNAAMTVTVRFDADRKGEADREGEWTRQAAVAWMNDEIDAAILTIKARSDTESVTSIRFARIAEIDAEIRCSTIGFPRFKLRTDRPTGRDSSLTQYRDSCHRFGLISPMSHSREGTIEIRVEPPERDPDPDRSPWEGMSGAAVFVGETLVGIVSRHDRQSGLGVLTATRVDRWYQHQDRAALSRLLEIAGLPDAIEDLPEAIARADHAITVTPSRDVYVSYHQEDLDAAEQVGDQLEAHGIHTVRERRRASAGTGIRQAIEIALTRTEAVALLIGRGGLGAWHAQELRSAYDDAIRRRGDVRLIPVLLPGADPAELPASLTDKPTVDLRQYLHDPDAIGALVALVQGRAPQQHGVQLPDHPAPYPSLRAFTAAEAVFFFGRSVETRHLTDRVRNHPFTAVFGASGAGKSSLVMAGLLPTLGNDWLARTMVPGERPLTALAQTLATASPYAATFAEEFEAAMKQSHDALAGILTSIARDAPEVRTILLIVDQFEEVFTYAKKPHVLADGGYEFIANICHAVNGHRDLIRVVITLRADFFEPCLGIAELRSQLQAHQLLLGALDDASLREAILLPAQSVGALFERGLVERILTDMRGRPGALPLLQTALAELWRRRRGVWLTHEDYNSIHGIGGALNQLADRIYAELSLHQQQLARSLLVRLVALGEAATHTRRRVRRHELDIVGADPGEIDRLLLRLSDQDVRLISTDRDTVELTHEALIDGWDTLHEWLRQNETDLRTHRQLTEDALHWYDNGRDDSYLYRGLRLAAARDWAERKGGEMSRLEDQYLTASRQVEESVRAREALDRTVARAGQSIFELENSPEEAILLAVLAAADAPDDPLVQRAMFRVHDTARIQRILRGHDDRISSVTWHPAGEVLATGSYDGTVRLWDVASGKICAVLTGHLNCVTCIAFDPAGVRIASGSWDNTAKIWDLTSNKTLLTLEGHEEMVSSVTWSPSARSLATGSQDKTARIWDVATGESRCVLRGHNEWVRSVEWHPNEKAVLTGSYDHTAKLWKIPSGRLVKTLKGHDGPVPAVAWSADGTEALTASEDGTIQLWNMSEHSSVRRIRVHTSPVYCVAWIPDGRLAVTGSEDGQVRVFDVDTGTLTLTLPGHKGWVSSVAWSPGGSTIASGSEDATARVSSYLPAGFAARPIGEHDGWVSSASWRPDGYAVATAGRTGVTRIWNPGSAAEIVRLGDTQTLTVAWSPSGNFLACGGWAGALTIWETASWTVAYTGALHRDRITTLAWAPGEDLLASGSYDGTARLWSTHDWAEVGRVDNNNWVMDVAWSPEGDRLVIASWNNDAQIWRIAAETDETALSNLTGHTASLHAADWSRSGRLVLTSSGDGTARLWDPDTLNQVYRVGAGEAHTAAFNPVHQQIVTGSRDGGLRLWSIASGMDLLATFQHPASILTAVWRPDGEEVLTGCEDGTIQIWPTSPEKVLSAVERRLSALFPKAELSRRLGK